MSGVSEQETANTVARFLDAVDSQDWASAERLLCNPVHIDYVSFGGGEPADVPPAQILTQWRGVLPGFDHTHHQLGNLEIEVDGDGAHVASYVTAHHVLDDSVWTVVGRYRIALRRADSGAGWQIASLRFLFRFQTGEPSLPQRAMERVAAGPPEPGRSPAG